MFDVLGCIRTRKSGNASARPTQVRLALASGKLDINEESHVLIEEVALG